MADNCGFNGNPDLYGLGIRLSLYIQLLTMALVATFIPQSMYYSFFANTNLSLFVSSWIIILKLSSSREIRGVELGIFPVLIGSAYAGVIILLSNWHSTKFQVRSKLTVVAAISYWLWFSWSGLDVLPSSGCAQDYVFVFAKVDLYGWFRTAMKVGYIVYLILYLIFALIPPDPIESDSGASESKWIKLVKGSSTIVLLAISIVSTELTISWNHIHDVSSISTLRSVGQLLPLVIALGQFVCVLYLAFRGDEHTRVSEDDGSGLCPERFY
ncbi:hypothetical protein FOXG_19281 [Fusarium oxysporum f. sp. lycopersici 4287]|uniref:Uncharacterized protein n=1 Tax=Fusarium oxysporum f. sp. lycopersici (strain 4287 / CBS 123668 / FGSC 9935 / NRRL 34936) TaxID=426428 RepID=A0A0J9UZ47_FUSO4|nr:hypothetical protein FOXG_19281 [Fusarium oxysporum f. sp. lycopersici 4287]KNB04385.1 hypothetical protein FOXG_19281 [Fusarium oxysporum f. sp. lycopersici 4287]